MTAARGLLVKYRLLWEMESALLPSKKAFKPVIISHELIDSNLYIYTVSDINKDFSGIIELSLLDFKSASRLKNGVKKPILSPLSLKKL